MHQYRANEVSTWAHTFDRRAASFLKITNIQIGRNGFRSTAGVGVGVCARARVRVGAGASADVDMCVGLDASEGGDCAATCARAGATFLKRIHPFEVMPLILIVVPAPGTQA